MKTWIVALVGMVAVCGLSAQSADAHEWHHRKIDKRVAAVGVAAGVASTASYFWINDGRWKYNNANGSGLSQWGAYGVTTFGCAVLSPMVASAVVNRPLTMREAHVLVGSCVVPIIGGLIVNAIWDDHPEWEAKDKPVKVAHRRRR